MTRNDKVLLESLVRRADAISEILDELRDSMARINLDDYAVLYEGQAWFHWYIRAAAKMQTTRICFNDCKSFLKKAEAKHNGE